MPFIVIISSIVSLVVPAMEETIALFSLRILLSKVDFPALGLPVITVITPFLIALPYWKDFFSWSI